MSYFDLDKVAQEKKRIQSEKEKQKAIENDRLNEFKKNILLTFNLFLDMLKDYPKICEIRNIAPVSYNMKPGFFGREKKSNPFYTTGINSGPLEPFFNEYFKLLVDDSGATYLARPNFIDKGWNNLYIYYTIEEANESLLECYFKNDSPHMFRFQDYPSYRGCPPGYGIEVRQCDDDDRRPYLLFLLSLATYHATDYSGSYYRGGGGGREFEKMNELEKEAYVVRHPWYDLVSFRNLKSENEKIESLKNIVLQLPHKENLFVNGRGRTMM